MALNSDFKVKNSLYIGNSAYFTGCTNTEGEILSAGLPLTDVFLQLGEVSANCDLTTGTGITNVTYDGSATQEISIASACDTAWNGKTTCTGTTTPTSTETFTNKCGSNSQWVNDEGYTNCVGDITEVTTTGDYLSGGGTTGAINIGLQSGCAEKWDNASAGSVVSVTGTGAVCSTGGTSPVISINSACDTKWDQSTCAGINCTGTTTPTSTETFTNKSGSNNQWTNDAGYTCNTGTTTPSNTQTFTNKSGSNSQWTNDLGYTTCTGDITGITATTLLSGTALAGVATIGIDSGALDYLNQSGCAGILCTGTTTAANTQTFTNKCGSNNQWVNDAGYTCNTGTVTSVGGTGGIGSTGGTTPSLSIDAACNTKWDQSACAGITCVGTITEVTTCAAYLTGGGTSGSFNVGIDSACGSKWDSAAAGGVTSVTGGDGVDVTGGLTPTVCVDCTVARTDVAETFTNNVTIQGDLTVSGTTTTLDTLVETTSAFTISNHGTGPALSVEQTGTNDLATFTDSEGGTVCVRDGAKLKITPSSAADAFCVGGDGRITGDTILNGGLSLCGVSGGTDDTVLVLGADGSVSTDEIDTKVWGTSLVDGVGSCNVLPKYTNGTGTVGDSNVTDSGSLITLGSNVTLGNAATLKLPSAGGTVYTEDKVYTATVGTTATTVNTVLKSGLNSVKYEVTLVKGVNITAFEIHAVYNGTGPCGTVYAIVDAQAATQLDEVTITSTGTTIDLNITAASATTTATIYAKAKY